MAHTTVGILTYLPKSQPICMQALTRPSVPDKMKSRWMKSSVSQPLTFS